METENRRHRRRNTLMAIMFTPNGERHSASVLNMSEGGARLCLPEDDWTPTEGAALRMFFELDPDQPIVVHGLVVRVGIDHLGVLFAPAQEQQINEVLSSLR
ncbi:PilZ domain-containing protein [Lysobacter solisilvae (ex Woo and Kim 2020)]|uniref:PilZ domain-containing protein n=1 Tax=Agrilutibacter terrestris TaxID=2865112 RepID=A0A7H0FWZ4_9GAMM|nr:PilZ domain-containing protein [Lysobacter terrestris]QNP40560.1 PilZ domain-containing protein [Lysobacter terrestris]